MTRSPKYTVNELQAIDALLRTVPRGPGVLPFKEFHTRPEWQLLLRNHNEKAIHCKMSKVWRQSVLQIQPAARASAAPAPAPEPPKETPKELNHAFNFCPNCGFGLNL